MKKYIDINTEICGIWFFDSYGLKSDCYKVCTIATAYDMKKYGWNMYEIILNDNKRAEYDRTEKMWYVED